MQPEAFTKKAAGPGALDGAADFAAGHDAELWVRALGQQIPVRHKAALGKAISLLANADEIAVLSNA